MLKSIGYIFLVGIVGAAIVHILIIMAVPGVTERDAWDRFRTGIDAYQFVILDEVPDFADMVGDNDPLFRSASCHFELSDGPLRLFGQGDVPFWSLSISGDDGISVFSFNDRNASDGVLDIVLATPADAADLRKDLPPELEQSFIVETGIDRGYVVLRAFVPDPSWSGNVARFLRNAGCGSV